MAYPKTWLFLFLFLLTLPLVSFGQNRNTPFSTTKNFISYRFGAGYPFFRDKDVIPKYASAYQLYEFSNVGFNYAFYGGFGLGHSFGKLFSLGVSPLLMYSKFASTGFHSQYISNPGQTLVSENIGNFHYNHFSLLVPLEFKFKIQKDFDVSFGVFVLKPFSDFEYKEYTVIDHRYHPPKTYPFTKSYKNRRSYYRSGLHGQLSFLLNERDWQKKRIKLEYYHALTSANNQIYERWILVSFEKVFYK